MPKKRTIKNICFERGENLSSISSALYCSEELVDSGNFTRAELVIDSAARFLSDLRDVIPYQFRKEDYKLLEEIQKVKALVQQKKRPSFDNVTRAWNALNSKVKPLCR